MSRQRTCHQQKIVSAATIKMQRTKLRRICARWRKVTNEAKLRQELELEKQQLWRKVRGWLDETNEPSIGFAKFIILNKILRSTMFYM
ncbi:hypothetical protein GQ600_947 [Phytophthora cactorum]|nr:hypothetical protein GQ600_947 [Phytophthora cactorum]